MATVFVRWVEFFPHREATEHLRGLERAAKRNNKLYESEIRRR